MSLENAIKHIYELYDLASRLCGGSMDAEDDVEEILNSIMEELGIREE